MCLCRSFCGGQINDFGEEEVEVHISYVNNLTHQETGGCKHIIYVPTFYICPCICVCIIYIVQSTDLLSLRLKKFHISFCSLV